jgi:membrane protein DedA with SNARE-associated domain/rhodanese-related sulfurtransferase
MEILTIVAHHGYLLIAGMLFLFCMGIPMPAAITLVAAGAASADHVLSAPVAFLSAIGGALAGDILLYLGGRYTGWWLLNFLCRASLSPDKCMFRAANYFYDRGARTLLTAKFIPGVSMIAAPVAGSLNLRPMRFLRYDLIGVVAYCGAYFAVGYLFHRFFLIIAHALGTFGRVAGALVVIAILGYILAVYITGRRNRFPMVELISPQEVKKHLDTPDPEHITVIADVRSHGYYETDMQRIRNSIRIEPNRLAEEMTVMKDLMAPKVEVFVYCTCAREATSRRVAHMLQERGIHARVIAGGLRAWKKAGFETETVPVGDLEHLPVFE